MNRTSRRAAAAKNRRYEPVPAPTRVAPPMVPATTSVTAVDGQFIISIKAKGNVYKVTMSPDEGARHMAECLAAMEQLDPSPIVMTDAEDLLAESIGKMNH